MTIDERLEKLTERHEALTINLELLSRDREADKQRMDKLVGAVEQLVTVMQSHERRIAGLEGGPAH